MRRSRCSGGSGSISSGCAWRRTWVAISSGTSPSSEEGELDPITADVLQSTLADTYSEADRALGRILDALPGEADVLVVSPLGMDEIQSRVDLLPEMLARVLSGGEETEAAGNLLWRPARRFPSSCGPRPPAPSTARRRASWMARLSTARVDWSRTPAFVLPSDQQGHIRLNVRGRERDGILDPAEARAVETGSSRGSRASATRTAARRWRRSPDPGRGRRGRAAARGAP